MGREYRKFNAQDGTTVVEVMVVVIIISIIAAFAIMQKGTANEQFQRQNVARELKFAFERARFDSVKRRADAEPVRAKVVVDTTSFTLATDRDLDGTITTADNSQYAIGGQNLVIAGQGETSVPLTIYFDQRGETVNFDGTPMTASFYVCHASCASPSNENANIVLITPTGTVNLMPGGATPQTFNEPTVAEPIGDAANIDLNSWAQLPTPTP